MFCLPFVIADFSRATASLFFNGNRQTCLRDGKLTLKVALFTEFCPGYDKRDSGNFVKTLKMQVTLMSSCPRARAITYAKRPL